MPAIDLSILCYLVMRSGVVVVVVALFLFGILTSLLLLKTKISLHLGALSCSWLHWCDHIVI